MSNSTQTAQITAQYLNSLSKSDARLYDLSILSSDIVQALGNKSNFLQNINTVSGLAPSVIKSLTSAQLNLLSKTAVQTFNRVQLMEISRDVLQGIGVGSDNFISKLGENISYLDVSLLTAGQLDKINAKYVDFILDWQIRLLDPTVFKSGGAGGVFLSRLKNCDSFTYEQLLKIPYDMLSKIPKDGVSSISREAISAIYTSFLVKYTTENKGSLEYNAAVAGKVAQTFFTKNSFVTKLTKDNVMGLVTNQDGKLALEFINGLTLASIKLFDVEAIAALVVGVGVSNINNLFWQYGAKLFSELEKQGVDLTMVPKSVTDQIDTVTEMNEWGSSVRFLVNLNIKKLSADQLNDISEKVTKNLSADSVATVNISSLTKAGSPSDGFIRQVVNTQKWTSGVISQLTAKQLTDLNEDAVANLTSEAVSGVLTAYKKITDVQKKKDYIKALSESNGLFAQLTDKNIKGLIGNSNDYSLLKDINGTYFNTDNWHDSALLSILTDISWMGADQLNDISEKVTKNLSADSVATVNISSLTKAGSPSDGFIRQVVNTQKWTSGVISQLTAKQLTDLNEDAVANLTSEAVSGVLTAYKKITDVQKKKDYIKALSESNGLFAQLTDKNIKGLIGNSNDYSLLKDINGTYFNTDNWHDSALLSILTDISWMSADQLNDISEKVTKNLSADSVATVNISSLTKAGSPSDGFIRQVVNTQKWTSGVISQLTAKQLTDLNEDAVANLTSEAVSGVLTAYKKITDVQKKKDYIKALSESNGLFAQLTDKNIKGLVGNKNDVSLDIVADMGFVALSRLFSAKELLELGTVASFNLSQLNALELNDLPEDVCISLSAASVATISIDVLVKAGSPSDGFIRQVVNTQKWTSGVISQLTAKQLTDLNEDAVANLTSEAVSGVLTAYKKITDVQKKKDYIKALSESNGLFAQLTDKNIKGLIGNSNDYSLLKDINGTYFNTDNWHDSALLSILTDISWMSADQLNDISEKVTKNLSADSVATVNISSLTKAGSPSDGFIRQVVNTQKWTSGVISQLTAKQLTDLNEDAVANLTSEAVSGVLTAYKKITDVQKKKDYIKALSESNGLFAQLTDKNIKGLVGNKNNVSLDIVADMGFVALSKIFTIKQLVSLCSLASFDLLKLNESDLNNLPKDVSAALSAASVATISIDVLVKAGSPSDGFIRQVVNTQKWTSGVISQLTAKQLTDLNEDAVANLTSEAVSGVLTAYKKITDVQKKKDYIKALSESNGLFAQLTDKNIKGLIGNSNDYSLLKDINGTYFNTDNWHDSALLSILTDISWMSADQLNDISEKVTKNLSADSVATVNISSLTKAGSPSDGFIRQVVNTQKWTSGVISQLTAKQLTDLNEDAVANLTSEAVSGVLTAYNLLDTKSSREEFVDTLVNDGFFENLRAKNIAGICGVDSNHKDLALLKAISPNSFNKFEDKALLALMKAVDFQINCEYSANTLNQLGKLVSEIPLVNFANWDYDIEDLDKDVLKNLSAESIATIPKSLLLDLIEKDKVDTKRGQAVEYKYSLQKGVTAKFLNQVNHQISQSVGNLATIFVNQSNGSESLNDYPDYGSVLASGIINKSLDAVIQWEPKSWTTRGGEKQNNHADFPVLVNKALAKIANFSYIFKQSDAINFVDQNLLLEFIKTANERIGISFHTVISTLVGMGAGDVLGGGFLTFLHEQDKDAVGNLYSDGLELMLYDTRSSFNFLDGLSDNILRNVTHTILKSQFFVVDHLSYFNKFSARVIEFLFDDEIVFNSLPKKFYANLDRLERFNDAFFNKLGASHADFLALIPSNKLSQIRNECIPNITLKYFSAEQLGYLTGTQVSFVNSKQFNELNDEQKVAICEYNISNLKDEILVTVDATIINKVSQSAIMELSVEKLMMLGWEKIGAFLTKDAIWNLSDSNLVTYAKSFGKSFDYATVFGLSENQYKLIHNYVPYNYSSITECNIDDFNSDTLSLLPLVRKSVVAELSDIIPKLPKEWIWNLDPVQFYGLDKSVYSELRYKPLFLYSLNELKSISVSDIRNKILPETISLLSAQQLGSLGSLAIRSLSVEQLNAISATTLNGLSSNFYRNLSPEQLTVVVKNNQGLLTSTLGSFLYYLSPTDQTKTVSFDRESFVYESEMSEYSAWVIASSNRRTQMGIALRAPISPQNYMQSLIGEDAHMRQRALTYTEQMVAFEYMNSNFRKLRSVRVVAAWMARLQAGGNAATAYSDSSGGIDSKFLATILLAQVLEVPLSWMEKWVDLKTSANPQIVDYDVELNRILADNKITDPDLFYANFKLLDSLNPEIFKLYFKASSGKLLSKDELTKLELGLEEFMNSMHGVNSSTVSDWMKKVLYTAHTTSITDHQTRRFIGAKRALKAVAWNSMGILGSGAGAVFGLYMMQTSSKNLGDELSKAQFALSGLGTIIDLGVSFAEIGLLFSEETAATKLARARYLKAAAIFMCATVAMHMAGEIVTYTNKNNSGSTNEYDKARLGLNIAFDTIQMVLLVGAAFGGPIVGPVCMVLSLLVPDATSIVNSIQFTDMAKDFGDQKRYYMQEMFEGLAEIAALDATPIVNWFSAAYHNSLEAKLRSKLHGKLDELVVQEWRYFINSSSDGKSLVNYFQNRIKENSADGFSIYEMQSITTIIRSRINQKDYYASDNSNDWYTGYSNIYTIHDKAMEYATVFDDKDVVYINETSAEGFHLVNLDISDLTYEAPGRLVVDMRGSTQTMQVVVKSLGFEIYLGSGYTTVFMSNLIASQQIGRVYGYGSDLGVLVVTTDTNHISERLAINLDNYVSLLVLGCAAGQFVSGSLEDQKYQSSQDAVDFIELKGDRAKVQTYGNGTTVSLAGDDCELYVGLGIAGGVASSFAVSEYLSIGSGNNKISFFPSVQSLEFKIGGIEDRSSVDFARGGLHDKAFFSGFDVICGSSLGDLFSITNSADIKINAGSGVDTINVKNSINTAIYANTGDKVVIDEYSDDVSVITGEGGAIISSRSESGYYELHGNSDVLEIISARNNDDNSFSLVNLNEGARKISMLGQDVDMVVNFAQSNYTVVEDLVTRSNVDNTGLLDVQFSGLQRDWIVFDDSSKKLLNFYSDGAFDDNSQYNLFSYDYSTQIDPLQNIGAQIQFSVADTTLSVSQVIQALSYWDASQQTTMGQFKGISFNLLNDAAMHF